MIIDSLRDALKARAEQNPAAPALCWQGAPQTWGEVEGRVEAVAGWLGDLGVAPGARVGALVRNSPAFVQLFHALLRLDALFVPLNTRLTPGELRPQVDDIGLDLLVVDLAHKEHVTQLNGVPVAVMGGTGGTQVSLSGSRITRPRKPFPGPQAALVVFTSGTTGRPRPVALTTANLEASARASAAVLDLSSGDCWLACLPLYHVGGLGILVRSALTGCAVEIHERFDAEAVNRAAGMGGVTVLSVVPTMLRRMLRDPSAGQLPGSLRCLLLGGGPVPPSLITEALERGMPVAPTYGLTEASSQVTVLLPAEAATRPGSAGRPVAGAEVRIRGENGEPAPIGEMGEVLVRGPMVASGGLDGMGAMSPEGWLPTGDLGWLDDDGYLYVSDRRSDLIVSGGENVMPAEVEAVLLSHPGVAEAAVYGRTDDEWGHVVCAAVVPSEQASVGPDELLAFCRARLAGYKVPRELEFVAELPKTAAGKIRRSTLREAGEKRARRANGDG